MNFMTEHVLNSQAWVVIPRYPLNSDYIIKLIKLLNWLNYVIYWIVLPTCRTTQARTPSFETNAMQGWDLMRDLNIAKIRKLEDETNMSFGLQGSRWVSTDITTQKCSRIVLLSVLSKTIKLHFVLGTVGFFACFFFVRKIYSIVKVD